VAGARVVVVEHTATGAGGDGPILFTFSRELVLKNLTSGDSVF
jgi:hypothetical protein